MIKLYINNNLHGKATTRYGRDATKASMSKFFWFALAMKNILYGARGH